MIASVDWDALATWIPQYHSWREETSSLSGKGQAEESTLG